jgi:hypothetical protein
MIGPCCASPCDQLLLPATGVLHDADRCVKREVKGVGWQVGGPAGDTVKHWNDQPIRCILSAMLLEQPFRSAPSCHRNAYHA